VCEFFDYGEDEWDCRDCKKWDRVRAGFKSDYDPVYVMAKDVEFDCNMRVWVRYNPYWGWPVWIELPPDT